MDEFLGWLLGRARRPSTWIGLGMLAVVLGMEPTSAQRVARAVALIVTDGARGVADAEPAGRWRAADGEVADGADRAGKRPEGEVDG